MSNSHKPLCMCNIHTSHLCVCVKERDTETKRTDFSAMWGRNLLVLGENKQGMIQEGNS